MQAQDHKLKCPFCSGLHWHKYKYLEEKMLELSRYITIDRRNLCAWGEEIADIIVLTGNAMDTFFKDMYDCPNFGRKEFNKQKKSLKLPDYQRIYEDYYELSENTVYVPYGLGEEQVLRPFKDFALQQPEWWEAYNQTKHGFYTSMETANLGNALNLLAGLLILNALHFCSKYHLTWTQVIEARFGAIIPLYTLGILTRSKVGATIGGGGLSINTKLFNFSYRLDESIGVRDDPLIQF